MMINPRGMDVIEWTDRTTPLLPVQPMKLARAEDWKEWARHAIQDPDIARFNPPQPDVFDDWQEWAERFIQTVSTSLG